MSTSSEYKQFSLPEDLYQEGSPILIHKAELVRPEEGGDQIFRMDIENLGEKIIRDVKVELLLVDVNGALLEKTNIRYRRDIPPEGKTENWELSNISNDVDATLLGRGAVVFEDKTYWYGHLDTFSPMPKPKSIPEKDIDVQQYQEHTSEENLYEPWQWHGLWRCSCGAVNTSDQCRKCKLEKKSVWSHYRKSSRSFCPECHEPLLKLTKYCPYCGNTIDHLERNFTVLYEEESPEDDTLPKLKAPRRPWWFWLVLILALGLFIGTIWSINSSDKTDKPSTSSSIQTALSPLDQLLNQAKEQADVEFGEGEYEVVADRDKKIIYVNGWPEKAYADLNSAKMNETDGLTQWRLWKETITINCETMKRAMQDKGMEDWSISWNVRSNRNHNNVLLTIFDGQVLYDDLEH